VSIHPTLTKVSPGRNGDSTGPETVFEYSAGAVVARRTGAGSRQVPNGAEESEQDGENAFGDGRRQQAHEEHDRAPQAVEPAVRELVELFEDELHVRLARDGRQPLAPELLAFRQVRVDDVVRR
jgi:hypothetical protein